MSEMREFLTPKRPDGKGGALVTLQAEAETPAFAEPLPYWTLSPEERTALARERETLLASLPGLEWAERTNAETRIQEIERLLRSDRSGVEAGRRSGEREAERRREQRGDQARNVPPGSCRAGQPATADGAYRHVCTCGQHEPENAARFAQEDQVHDAVKAVLIAAQRAHQHRGSGTGGAEQHFAPPVPYFATGGA